MSTVSISLSSSPLSSFAVLSSSSEETFSSLSGLGFVDVVVCTANCENYSVASSTVVVVCWFCWSVVFSFVRL